MLEVLDNAQRAQLHRVLEHALFGATVVRDDSVRREPEIPNDRIAERFYEGLLVDQYGAAQYSFSDGAQTGKDFLSINALNRAVSVAVPRLKISGKFNVPESMVRQPIILRDGTGDLLVKSFEWDLYNDEIRIEATMLPVATLEVASETITSL